MLKDKLINPINIWSKAEFTHQCNKITEEHRQRFNMDYEIGINRNLPELENLIDKHGKIYMKLGHIQEDMGANRKAHPTEVFCLMKPILYKHGIVLSTAQRENWDIVLSFERRKSKV